MFETLSQNHSKIANYVNIQNHQVSFIQYFEGKEVKYARYHEPTNLIFTI